MRRIEILLCCLIVPGTFLGADLKEWKRIARETNEPSFGQRIEEVFSNSQAEDLGLKAGDFIVQYDGQQVRGFGIKRVGNEQLLFFIPQGGEVETMTIRGGKLGYKYSGIWRPWVDYLRGEIGTPSEEWENGVCEVLLTMEEDPDSAETQWTSVREAGYPEDELDAFIRAYLAWRQKKPIPVREAFDKIYEEFETFPAVYFQALEDLAFASNHIGVLRDLRELDPDSASVSEKRIEIWDALEKEEDGLPRDLLQIAQQKRGQEVTDRLTMPEGQKSKTRLVTDMKKKAGHAVKPGFYRYLRGQIPAGVRNFHAQFVVKADCMGYHEKWDSLMRFSLYSLDDGLRERYPSGVLATIGIGDGLYRGNYVSTRGGHSSSARYYGEPDLSLGLVRQEESKIIKVRPSGKSPSQLDLVLYEGEAAAYLDGRCYFHQPVDSDLETFSVDLHICGIFAHPKKFSVWEVDAE